MYVKLRGISTVYEIGNGAPFGRTSFISISELFSPRCWLNKCRSNFANEDFNLCKLVDPLGGFRIKKDKTHNELSRFEKKVWPEYIRRDLRTRRNYSYIRLLWSAHSRTPYEFRDWRGTTNFSWFVIFWRPPTWGWCCTRPTLPCNGGFEMYGERPSHLLCIIVGEGSAVAIRRRFAREKLTSCAKD